MIGKGGDVFELLAESAHECPDLILFDIDLVNPYPSNRRRNGRSISDMIDVLHRICAGTKLVAMSSRFEAKQEALAAGADGFISKTDPPEIVWTTIAGIWKKDQAE